ncbi:MAG: antitoxin Xre/MbcA/ParS toxin-binding domain-containing protein [Janthinobacterium lividum]
MGTQHLEAQPVAAATLSKAVVRAASALKINQSTLAEVLGVSAPTVSRLVAGKYQIEAARGKEWQMALLFVRMFRSLDAIVGSAANAQTWLNGENLALNSRPIDLIRSVQGLVSVVEYLDLYRGRL